MMESSSAAPINLDGTPALDGEMSDQVTIGYGTGQVVGEFVRDEVCIGCVGRSGETTQVEPLQSCQNLQVVVAVEMSKQPFKNFLFDGIFGLGLGSLALSKNFSFFNTFVQQGGFGSPHFSVFLTDSEAGDESEIAFGGYNPERLSGSLSWAPVVKPDMGYWQLELLAVRVDGQPLDVCKDGSCRAVIDTGTSHLGIPSPHDEVLSDLLIRPAIGVSDCNFEIVVLDSGLAIPMTPDKVELLRKLTVCLLYANYSKAARLLFEMSPDSSMCKDPEGFQREVADVFRRSRLQCFEEGYTQVSDCCLSCLKLLRTYSIVNDSSLTWALSQCFLWKELLGSWIHRLMPHRQRCATSSTSRAFGRSSLRVIGVKAGRWHFRR